MYTHPASVLGCEMTCRDVICCIACRTRCVPSLLSIGPKRSIDNAQKLCPHSPLQPRNTAVLVSSALHQPSQHHWPGKVASLPFRFKAGGNMAPIVAQHHHRSTVKQAQKPFKSRHATKSALKEASKGIPTLTYQRLSKRECSLVDS